MRLRKRATRMAEQEHRLIDYMYTTRKLGIALLSFLLIYTASTLIRTPLYALLLLRLGTTVGLMAGQLIDMLFYALSFMLPVKL